jgi:hypothetical protein
MCSNFAYLGYLIARLLLLDVTFLCFNEKAGTRNIRKSVSIFGRKSKLEENEELSEVLVHWEAFVGSSSIAVKEEVSIVSTQKFQG